MKTYFFISQRPGRLWRTPSLLSNLYRVLPQTVKQLARETDSSSSSVAEVKNTWSYIWTFPYAIQRKINTRMAFGLRERNWGRGAWQSGSMLHVFYWWWKGVTKARLCWANNVSANHHESETFAMDERISMNLQCLSIFSCRLFNDALSSYVTASNSMIKYKQRIGKDLEGTGRGLIKIPRHYSGWIKKTMRNRSKDKRCPARGLNRALLEEKFRGLPLSQPAR